MYGSVSAEMPAWDPSSCSMLTAWRAGAPLEPLLAPPAMPRAAKPQAIPRAPNPHGAIEGGLPCKVHRVESLQRAFRTSMVTTTGDVV